MTLQESSLNGLIVSPAPHIHCGRSLSGAMLTFFIALIPAAIFGIHVYGMDAVRVISLSIAGAMASEALIQRLFRRPVTISDGSAALTGLVLALILPPSVPWWLVLMAAFVSILIGKQIFGGNGCNPFNPALIGWAAVRISWYKHIDFSYSMVTYDVKFPIEYPLSLLKAQGAKALGMFKAEDLLMGNQIGGIGSAAVLLILAGGLFLLIRGVISWRIPLFFLAGTALTAYIFYLSDSSKYATPLFHILTGNLMIGAFFLSTEHASSPVNGWPMVIYGLGCGVITVVLRTWSVYPDGVIFAILIMNILNPVIDKIRPRIPGREVVEVEA